MKIIKAQDIIAKVKGMIINSNYLLDSETLISLKSAKKNEKSEMGRYVLDEILANAEIARSEQVPLCQDTGVSVFFVKWGQECTMTEMTLQDALDEAVREAYRDGYLRKSMLKDPMFDRRNTGDNTPAVIHLELVKGKKVEIQFLAKGAGGDNASKTAMLMPYARVEDVKKYVIKVCKEAGADSCPPWILGIGIGGTFDTVGVLAKQAMLRDIGSKHADPNYDQLEKDLLVEVNKLGMGPQGLGGVVTALACFIEYRPCHAASLPVAVNIQCHSNRKGRVVL